MPPSASAFARVAGRGRPQQCFSDISAVLPKARQHEFRPMVRRERGHESISADALRRSLRLRGSGRPAACQGFQQSHAGLML